MVRVTDDEWSSESIRILAAGVAVIPVCASLLDLNHLSGEFDFLLAFDLR
jgi:hypothetical protein